MLNGIDPPRHPDDFNRLVSIVGQLAADKLDDALDTFRRMFNCTAVGVYLFDAANLRLGAATGICQPEEVLDIGKWDAAFSERLRQGKRPSLEGAESEVAIIKASMGLEEQSEIAIWPIPTRREYETKAPDKRTLFIGGEENMSALGVLVCVRSVGFQIPENPTGNVFSNLLAFYHRSREQKAIILKAPDCTWLPYLELYQNLSAQKDLVSLKDTLIHAFRSATDGTDNNAVGNWDLLAVLINILLQLCHPEEPLVVGDAQFLTDVASDLELYRQKIERLATPPRQDGIVPLYAIRQSLLCKDAGSPLGSKEKDSFEELRDTVCRLVDQIEELNSKRFSDGGEGSIDDGSLISHASKHISAGVAKAKEAAHARH